MYRANYNLRRFTCNYIFNVSSIGDTICTLPALMYITKHHGQRHNIRIWIGEDKKDLITPFIDAQFIRYTYNRFCEVNNNGELSKVVTTDGQINNCNSSLVDFFSFSIAGQILPVEEQCYPKYPVDNIDIQRLCDLYDTDFKNTVILHPNYAWLNKTFTARVWNEIAEYSHGIGLMPIFVGRNMSMEHGHPDNLVHFVTGKNINFSRGKNLINQTTIPELMKIISLSRLVVAPDCGILHMAGMCDVPIVGAYTIKPPKQLMPIRRNPNTGLVEIGWNVYPVVPDVECVGCASNMIFAFNADFRHCVYDDYKCVFDITSDKIIAQMNKALGI